MNQATHGIFHLPANFPLASAVTVKLGKCQNTGDLLQCLGTALAFPDWYGANFDALFECLSDPDSPAHIHLLGLEGFANRNPDDFSILLEVLRAACDARAEMEAPLIVCIDTAAADIAPWPDM